ncbi:hypothetical protein TNCT_694401 [Trichonephila clavata]|uniref:Uncharacterized protein n=1 Tax=Trichonephila clavata TaxID=2740835 RepID=A0A8X6J231_TRICU|nr:hypothetical protein TNCT_694401 [Trichonephila clavata]
MPFHSCHPPGNQANEVLSQHLLAIKGRAEAINGEYIYKRKGEEIDDILVKAGDPSRPVMEYASSIWVHASKITLEKLDNVQARAAKVIVVAVSSANNLKVKKSVALIVLRREDDIT